MLKKTKILGIDLGTTNSCVAIFKDGKYEVLQNKEGRRVTPSVVSIGKKDDKGNREICIGDVASRQGMLAPERTIYAFKRLIGRQYSSISEGLLKKIPYKVISKRGMPWIKVDDEEFPIQYVSSLLLKRLVDDANDALSLKNEDKIKNVVVTVPAHFDDESRNATKLAGELAGLVVDRVINEPTAAAMAYGYGEGKDGNVLVFDLGGGTFDVTSVHIDGDLFKVLSTAGNQELGGEDFDCVLTDYVITELRKTTPGVSIVPGVYHRIKESCKLAKEELSSVQQTVVSIPFLTTVGSEHVHLNVTVYRSVFEKLIISFVDEAIKTVYQAMDEASLTKDDISAVVLAGGSVRVPLVQKRLVDIFGESKIKKDINPDEAIAIGAAIQGSVLSGEKKDVVLMDIATLSLGIESLGGLMVKVIEKGSPIPTANKKIFTTTEDNQTSAQIAIYKGDRATVRDNKKLGEFTLHGIPPQPKNVPKIEVSFEIDSSGLLSVSAVDLGTGKKRDITLKPDRSLTAEEEQKMRDEAEKFAEQDKITADIIKTNNEIAFLSEEAKTDIEKIKKNEEKKQEFKQKVDSLFESFRVMQSQIDKEELEKKQEILDKIREILIEVSTIIKSESDEDASKKDSENKSEEEQSSSKESEDSSDKTEKGESDMPDKNAN